VTTLNAKNNLSKKIHPFLSPFYMI